MTALPTIDNLLSARMEVQPHIHQTPILKSERINEALGIECYFKSEHLQKTGSFKVRGALNALGQLNSGESRRGVITHSSGNHGQALAWAGRLKGIEVHVVVPDDAPLVKMEAMKSYGAFIHLCDPGQASREEKCQRLIEEFDYSFIPPYDDYRIIAGQSTMMQECIEQLPELDVAFVPVGGGGLLSGSLLATHYLKPDLKIYAAEPEGADDAFRSFREGKRLPLEFQNTIADGLRTGLGERNFPIIQEYVEDIITVSEKEIVDAMNWVFTYLKQAIEPSAAVSLAAIIKQSEFLQGKKVLSILCGGNANWSKLPF
jgi:threonine dehydratase